MRFYYITGIALLNLHFFFNTLMKVILKISRHCPLEPRDGDEKLNVDFVVVLFPYAGKPFFFHSGPL